MVSQEKPIKQINTSDMQEKEFEGVKRTVVSGSHGDEMVPKRPPGYWTRERCYDEAKKYLTKAELRKNNQTVYNAARRNGWLDDYTWLADKKRPNGYWNRETCFEEAKKYKSRNEFQDNSKGAYYVAANNGWLDDYTWLVNQNIKWNEEK